MNNPKTKRLIGRMFGYNLDDGGPDGDNEVPLLILAEVLPAPRGFDLGEGALWCRCYSVVCPEGEEGTVPISWLRTEVAPLMIPAMRHVFGDDPDRVERLARNFPTIPFRPVFGPPEEASR
jgi:hypothetical protein